MNLTAKGRLYILNISEKAASINVFAINTADKYVNWGISEQSNIYTTPGHKVISIPIRCFTTIRFIYTACINTIKQAKRFWISKEGINSLIQAIKGETSEA